jgi:hypothetical protein
VSRDPTHPAGPAWRARLEALVALIAALLVVSGALAAIYFRPHGHVAPAHVGRAFAAVAALRITHSVAAWTAVVLAVGVVLLGRPWLRPRAPAAASLAILAAFLVTGSVAPWDCLLPWSPPLGANMARPTPLLGHDGPFPELVGVNVTYDETVHAIGRLRLGPRGVGRLYLAHAVVLPLVGVAVAVFGWRRRRPSTVRG